MNLLKSGDTTQDRTKECKVFLALVDVIWLDIGLSQNRSSDTFKHQNSEFELPHMSLNLKLYSGSRPARLLKGGLENINSN